jgi:hypothetical protein
VLVMVCPVQGSLASSLRRLGEELLELVFEFAALEESTSAFC